MALKGVWEDKVNGKDRVKAEDINTVAKAVMNLEEVKISVSESEPIDGSNVWIDTDEEAPSGGTSIDVVASVGQVIAVNAVDEDGKPTEYKAVDLPEEVTPDFAADEGEKGHMLNNPFGEGAGTLFFSHTATFATDTAAKSGVVVSGASVTAILDTVYWLELNGEMLKCHWVRSGLFSKLLDEDGNVWVTRTLSDIYVSAQTAGTYTYSLYAPSEELMLEPQYLPPNIAKKSDIPKGGGVDVTASVGQTIIVKEVDANGKPTKWESADYQPRTHYQNGTKTETLLDVGVLVSENQFVMAGIVPIEVGKNYSVTWDGVAYECVANEINYVGSLVPALGNQYFIGGGNTNQPFLFISFEEKMGFGGAAMTDGVHTIKITREVPAYKTLDECYLDSSLIPCFIPFNIPVSGGDSPVFGASESDSPLVCEYIFDKLWNGRRVILDFSKCANAVNIGLYRAEVVGWSIRADTDVTWLVMSFLYGGDSYNVSYGSPNWVPKID